MRKKIETPDNLIVRKDYQELDYWDWTADEYIHYRMTTQGRFPWRLMRKFLIGFAIGLIIGQFITHGPLYQWVAGLW